MLQTEFTFTLPCGYIDEQGTVHRQGTMRRATAMDEVALFGDARVRANEAYLSILLLSRVVTHIGPISPVTPAMIEQLFATDFVYLQELYTRVNDHDAGLIETRCPTCGTHFVLDGRTDYDQT